MIIRLSYQYQKEYDFALTQYVTNADIFQISCTEQYEKSSGPEYFYLGEVKS